MSQFYSSLHARNHFKQTSSSHWIIMLYRIHRNTYKSTCTGLCSVSFTRLSRMPTSLHLKLLGLRYESMYQSSESRWDRNPLTDLWSQSAVEKPHGGRFTSASKTQGHDTMGGQLWKGKQRRLHLRLCALLCRRCSGKNTWGWIGRTNTDWQGLACGRG